MISPVSGNDPPVHNHSHQACKHVVTAHDHKVAEQPQPPETKEDNLELSHFAKVQSPRKQGYSVQEIAKIINMDVKTVTGYIG